jgi:hypothetical protein
MARAWLVVTVAAAVAAAGSWPTTRSCRRGLVTHREGAKHGLSGGNSSEGGGSMVASGGDVPAMAGVPVVGDDGGGGVLQHWVGRRG